MSSLGGGGGGGEGGFNRGVSSYRGVSSCQGVGISTIYRGVLILGGWNRVVPLHVEVSSFQGGLLIERCPHVKGLE